MSRAIQLSDARDAWQTRPSFAWPRSKAEDFAKSKDQVERRTISGGRGQSPRSN